MFHLAIIPFIPDLFVFVPLATYIWGRHNGSKRRRLNP